MLLSQTVICMNCNEDGLEKNTKTSHVKMNDSKITEKWEVLRCTNINGAIVPCIARTTIDTAGWVLNGKCISYYQIYNTNGMHITFNPWYPKIFPSSSKKMFKSTGWIQ